MKRPWNNTEPIERGWMQPQQKWGRKSVNHKRYNSRQWMNFRAFYWTHHPRICVECGKYANILDHIKPLTEGGVFLDENNVQGLCYRCHNKKHKGGRNE